MKIFKKIKLKFLAIQIYKKLTQNKKQRVKIKSTTKKKLKSKIYKTNIYKK